MFKAEFIRTLLISFFLVAFFSAEARDDEIKY